MLIEGKIMPYPFRRHNKFGAVRTNGMGSKLEAAVLGMLRLRERDGQIRDIKQQVSVDLGFKITWKVDFSFVDVQTGNTHYAEAKGFKTDRYLICLKLWRGGQGPGPLYIYEGSYQRPMLKEIVNPEK